MKTFTGTRLHLAILAGVAIVTLGARWALRQRHAQEFRQLGQAATDARAREVEAYWRTFVYADASAPDFRDKFLGTIHWSALELSGVQQEKLQARLRQVLAYLTHPTFEDYWRLRTEGLHYQFQPTATVSWTNVLHRSEADLSADPLQAVNALWNYWMAPSNRFAFARLTAFCLTNVTAATSRSNTVNGLLGGPVRKGFTAFREGLNPGLEYPCRDRLSLNGSNASVYFHTSFFAQASPGGAVGPVYLSLCWLPDDQAWAPSRMMSDNWLRLYLPF